jgi:hypothetical protein
MCARRATANPQAQRLLLQLMLVLAACVRQVLLLLLLTMLGAAHSPHFAWYAAALACWRQRTSRRHA